MEQEVNIKVVCLACQSAEKASQVFIHALKGYAERFKNDITINSKHNKIEKTDKEGKMVKVKELRKDGSQIEFVDMGQGEIKEFRRYARKYGVSYSMEKNKSTDPPTYYIYFKAKDSVLIDKAIGQFVADKMQDKNKEESLADKLSLAKEKAKKMPKKVRNKEHVR